MTSTQRSTAIPFASLRDTLDIVHRATSESAHRYPHRVLRRAFAIPNKAQRIRSATTLESSRPTRVALCPGAGFGPARGNAWL